MFSLVMTCKKTAISLITATMLFGSAFATSAASGDFMDIGSLTSQPIGHYEFCKREPGECGIRNRNTAPLKLTHAAWKHIVAINLSVNMRIEPMTDMEIYGQEEYWAYPTTAGAAVGDCEDYVLLKRRELAAAGIPLADLLITVVRKPDGEGHAVLTLRTDRGDFILDNLTDDVMHWQATDYTYLKRQAANNTGQWVTIEAPSNIVVGSVRP